jgi:Zn-dependent peptidase ImmA (M78 family)
LRIPFSVDGITLNLKIPGQRPRVLLKARPNVRRLRFTMAHELGHILIPWHVGTIIDHPEFDEADMSAEYWMLDAEANRFASELLMPSDWVANVVAAEETPRGIIMAIRERATVSTEAALRRARDRMPAGFVFAELDADGVVVRSGRTRNTIASRPEIGSSLDPEGHLRSADRIYEFAIGSTRHVWWEFDSLRALPDVADQREWREILDGIVHDLDPVRQGTTKRSLNAVVAVANGMIKTRRSPEAVYAAAVQYVANRSDLRWIVEHRDFNAYLVKRIVEFFSR